MLFIADAIVAPGEISKYFGEDAIMAKECEIAYNAILMALLWDAVATKNAKLLNLGVQHLPTKLERATWLNYVRCHDDIGMGFDDKDAALAGYDPYRHRRFLIDYFTGRYEGSPARGLPFGENTKTGDARISGSLASLAGLESAIEAGDEGAIDDAIRTILLLHSVILSFGGIPLLYYGDGIGMLNSVEYLADPSRRDDSRWAHRSSFDWNKAERRRQPGTVEYRIFNGLKKMISLRKELAAFADFDNRQQVAVQNSHLLVFVRSDPVSPRNRVLVVANFNNEVQPLELEVLRPYGYFGQGPMREMCSGTRVEPEANALLIPALSCCWLAD